MQTVFRRLVGYQMKDPKKLELALQRCQTTLQLFYEHIRDTNDECREAIDDAWEAIEGQRALDQAAEALHADIPTPIPFREPRP